MVSKVFTKEVANKIVNAMSENNGLITHDDLKNYKSFFRMPIAINYKRS